MLPPTAQALGKDRALPAANLVCAFTPQVGPAELAHVTQAGCPPSQAHPIHIHQDELGHTPRAISAPTCHRQREGSAGSWPRRAPHAMEDLGSPGPLRLCPLPGWGAPTSSFSIESPGGDRERKAGQETGRREADGEAGLCPEEGGQWSGGTLRPSLASLPSASLPGQGTTPCAPGTQKPS